jgi:hypothetical protein
MKYKYVIFFTLELFLVKCYCIYTVLLELLTGSVSGFGPDQGTCKNLWISCEYKEGLSDETKNRGPLYRSVYARAIKDPTQVASSL